MADSEDADKELMAQGDDWIEMERKTSLTDPKISRFQVAKVDFAADTPKCKFADDSDAAERQPLTDPNQANGDSDGERYDTHNVRSLRHYTREALPRADHYRNVMSVHGQLNRPTLDELHDPSLTMSPDHKYSKRNKGNEEVQVVNGAIKLGWIQGVFVRCLLNIWGVMLFLRLSWVVGQAGIGLGCLVILLASVVTVLTTLSMSAICTNGEVKGGGTYYMISRSLGPEFGGAIGLIFSLANAVAVAMYVVGFAETLVELLHSNGLDIVDGAMHDVRIIGCITVLFLFGIAIIGTEWESKAQIVLLIILLVSMADFVIGSFIPPNSLKKSLGFVGWDLNVMAENFGPDFRGETFISVFSVYFPAATGILAGANISGDLADPQTAIPKGTFLAIAITTVSYLWFAFTAGSVMLRDANAVEAVTSITEDIRNCSLAQSSVCEYGLMNYYGVMETVSAFGPIIYAGIFAATLSSALASLVSAPKVFQALCKDKLFPHIHFFARGYGKGNEPRRGYCLAFVIGTGCVAIGELNAIAPIISNFFLAAYCLINFSCFHATFARSPGFRPSFKYYNLWLSLLGAILCLSVMFIMNWWTALLTFAIVLGLYIYIYHRKPDVNWGSSTQAQTYKTALSSAFRLNQVHEHVKNYRPQILVLTGCPSSRPPLIDFAYHITKKISLLVCGHISKAPLTQRVRAAYSKQAYQFLHKRKIKAFYSLIEDESFSRGAKSLMQVVGIGKMKPNVLFMGYKSNWQDCSLEDVQEYFNVIHEAFDKHMSLGILRLQEGLDYSEFNDIEEITELPQTNGKKSRRPSLLKPELDGFPRNASSVQLSQAGSSRESTPPSTPSTERKNQVEDGTKGVSSTQVVKGLSTALPKDVLTSVNQFQRKQRKGTIDVWWLYDDGGLTMLIPYLLTTHSQWSSLKFRVFSLANKKDELDREQRNMAALLSKFRIDYSDVMVIPDITKPPKECSKQDFENIISKWKESDDTENENPNLISLAEILALKDKTNRHIRLRELLVQYSQNASLIVMTLPMPRKGTCSAPMYMAWLETLTRDMPPFLLIRGNQTSVLTFYS
ncbi:solute carrier family 12 member 2-like [Uloborus diversus]|uniref:solute carrier family 12 member 2-like n=1 Tax=Uloborus diversus TaxID=327109 RepID=UPI002409982B|nr:solute carrier family 12 member 2-like [Uloborus diversus]